MEPHFFVSLLLWYIVFLFATTLHEAAHAFVSAWGGDNTAQRGGQISLNPLPHMKREKWGMVIIPILSFFLNHGTWMIGWASAPFNPYWAARYPRKSFLMSLAGPLSHLPAIFIAFTAMVIGLRTGFFNLGHDFFSLVAAGSGGALSGSLAMFVNVLLQLNVVLLVFNLMPIPPLDGSEVWYLLIKSEETRLRLRMYSGSYYLIGLLLAWRFFSGVFTPVWVFIVKGLLSLSV